MTNFNAPNLGGFEEKVATMTNMNTQPIEQNVFISKPDNINHIGVKNYEELLGRALLPHELEMLQTIDAVEEYAWTIGENGGLDTGFPAFNKGVEGGLTASFILFAAAPNVGKSAFMIFLMKCISEKNENVYCEYMTLDDSANVLMPRWIAADQRITIGQAKNPAAYKDQPDILIKRNEGRKNLFRNVHRFSLRDSSKGNSIESLEARIKELRMNLDESVRIVIGVDSFYDLTTEEKVHRDEVHAHIAKRVKQMTVDYNVVIMATAHIRKNGSKRPTTEDLRDANRLEYEAELICLLHNEVGIREEAADIYWLDEDNESKKMPVLEMRFAKNKLSDFKGTIFYEMIPSYSTFLEASEDGQKRYSSLIYG